MRNIRVVELFAGVGGFRLGLEAASDKYKVIWANQWEPYKADQWRSIAMSRTSAKARTMSAKT